MEYKIQKIAENNIEVYYPMEVEIVGNGVGLAWDTSKPDHYGKERVNRELSELQSQKSLYDLKTDCPKCKAELSKIAEKETKLLEIKTELEKEVIK